MNNTQRTERSSVLLRLDQRRQHENVILPSFILSKLNVSIFVLSADGEIIYSNRRLDDSNELPLGLHLYGENRLRISEAKLRKHFRAQFCVSDACKARTEDNTALMGSVCSLEIGNNVYEFQPVSIGSSSKTGNKVACLVTVLGLGCWNAVVENRIKEDYHLTTAELDICRQLFSSDCTKTIARSRNTSVETVKTQLKSILQKTRINNRFEVMLMLHRRALSILNENFTVSDAKSGVD